MPILSTGGYNDKFLTFVSNVFNTQVVKCRGDYLHFVIKALDYLNKYTNDCFFITHGNIQDRITDRGKLTEGGSKQVKQHFFSLKDELYPYMIVNVRSGASFIRVDGPDKWEKLCGTSIGGAFFWGVLRLLNFYNDPTEAVSGAGSGDSSKIDMSVGDIYGGDYPGIGLPSNYIASSFGKLKDIEDPEELKTI
jgi:type II pantothenate kinase